MKHFDPTLPPPANASLQEKLRHLAHGYNNIIPIRAAWLLKAADGLDERDALRAIIRRETEGGRDG